MDLLRPLVAVFPIVQTHRLSDELELVLISLETYQDGALLRGILYDLKQSDPFWHPQLKFRAEDDQGREFQVLEGHGHGAEREWRFEYVLLPAPGPNSRTLRLELAEVRFRGWDVRISGDNVRELARKPAVGPWHFRVHLS